MLQRHDEYAAAVKFYFAVRLARVVDIARSVGTWGAIDHTLFAQLKEVPAPARVLLTIGKFTPRIFYDACAFKNRFVGKKAEATSGASDLQVKYGGGKGSFFGLHKKSIVRAI